MTYEVDRPILNTPSAEPARHWYIQRGRDPKIVGRRRDAFVLVPRRTAKLAARRSGGLQDYLPHINGRVVAGCFSKDLNPQAPNVILPGTGPEIERRGR